MALDCGCPEHYPAEWDGQDIDLSGHCTHTQSIPMLFHMPLAYVNYLQQQANGIEQLELTERWPGLVFTKTGMLRGEIIRLIEPSHSPSRLIKFLPADFKVRCLIHHGTMGTLRDSARKLQQSLFDEGKLPKEMYLCHLTCPLCAEQRGGDKILLLRRWQPSPTLERRVTQRQRH